jgi:AraC family transcriptional regulator
MSPESKVLHIKNMVCPRCVSTVREILESLDYEVEKVTLGQAMVTGKSTDPVGDEKLQAKLAQQGFELLVDPDRRLIEQIKTELLGYLKRQEQDADSGKELPKLSDYLSEKLHKNYSTLSKLFSEQESITIEKYLIRLKIERVKELVSYGEMTLSEIAWKLNYSSVQYLSNQFKQVTGMSVSDFKQASDSFRKPLDDL